MKKEKIRAGKSRDYHEYMIKFSIHTKTKNRPAFSKSYRFKSVYEKLRRRVNGARGRIT